MKLRTRYFTIMGMIVLCTVILSTVKAQSAVDNKESARVFVQKFYDWYTVLYSAPVDKKNPVVADMVAIKQKPGYFDTPLRKALIDDAEAQLKVKGEIVSLDYDPFLNAQDDGFSYQAGSVKQIGDKYFIDIHRAENGKTKKVILGSAPCIIAELFKINGQWVFANFITPSKQGQLDLLSTLNMLHKERDKNKSKG